MGTWAQEDRAQEGSVQAFRDSSGYLLRVAEAPCPEGLRSTSPGAVCYRHGYTDFFDFKEAVTPYMLEPGGRLEPWRVVTLQLAGETAEETAEVFRARYRPRGSSEPITLTYVSETLLLLEVSERRVSP